MIPFPKLGPWVESGWMGPPGPPALSGLQQAPTAAFTAIRLRLSFHFEEVDGKFLPPV